MKKALFASAVMAVLLISVTAVISDDEKPHSPFLQFTLS